MRQSRKTKGASDSSPVNQPPRGQRKGREWTDADRSYIESMRAQGIPVESIAQITGCAVSTLYNRFPDEMALGKEIANARVANALYLGALAGEAVKQIFWLKTRAGWKEASAADDLHSGRVHGVAEIPADMESAEEWQATAQKYMPKQGDSNVVNLNEKRKGIRRIKRA